MKTFKDLEFKPHSIIKGAVQARIKFPDGSELSIVGGVDSGLYGNGTTSFEMLSNRVNKTDGIRGWISKQQITRHMRYIQKNPLK